MHAPSDLTPQLKQVRKKLVKSFIKELGGKKQLKRALARTAALAANNPKKATRKLLKELGGKKALTRALGKALVAGAGVIAAALTAEHAAHSETGERLRKAHDG